MRIPRLDKSYRNLRRYRQIVGILLTYGFQEVVDRVNLLGRLRLGRRLRRSFAEKAPRTGLSYVVRLRMALEALGPTFVKLGQVLSMRSFLIPLELARELSRLQDEVAPVPFPEVQQVLEHELGGRMALFQSFEKTPIASASLSQVYRAVTVRGEEVVVKVQRPGIEQMVEADMDILMDLAQRLERYMPELEPYEPVEVVAELAKTTRRELDFKGEARNIELFARNFAGHPEVYVPKVFWETTTSRVLTTEWIRGIKVSDVQHIEEAGLDRRAVAIAGGRAILKQIFEDGFFHGDPHPGNLFVLPGNVIAPVDFGMMGRLDDVLVEELADLLSAAVEQNADKVIQTLLRVGVLDEGVDIRSLRLDLTDLIDRYYGLSLKQVDMKQALEEGMDVMRRYRVRVQPNLILLGRALGTYEEIGRILYPEFDLLPLARPYIRKLMQRRMSPGRVMRELMDIADQMRRLLRILPGEMEVIVKNMTRGKFGVELKHVGLAQFIGEIDRSTNRLSFSLVIAALIVGSSLVIQLEHGPFMFGYPIFGILGFVFAGVLGIGLLIAILRSGKL